MLDMLSNEHPRPARMYLVSLNKKVTPINAHLHIIYRLRVLLEFAQRVSPQCATLPDKTWRILIAVGHHAKCQVQKSRRVGLELSSRCLLS